MVMKKFINNPETLTKELLEGLALAHADKVEVLADNLVVNKKMKDADRVHIVTLGGTGHEPALEGFVGEGMFDVAHLSWGISFDGYLSAPIRWILGEQYG